MNKRQAKKYFKQINNTVKEHKSDSISNTKRIKHYTIVVPKRQIKTAEKKAKSIPPWLKKRSQKPQIKGFDAYKRRETYFHGPFDEFGSSLKGYERSAQSAGNRIESTHPGFFAKYIKLGPKLLMLIWDNYANYHNSSFYDANESFVDEKQYEFLIGVLDEQLDLFNKEFADIGE